MNRFNIFLVVHSTDAGRETGLGDRCLGLCAVNRGQVRRVVVKDQGEFRWELIT